MTYSEFKNKVENGEFSCIYLLEGEDAYFRERGLALLKNHAIEQPELNYNVLFGEKVTDQEIISSLTAYPFMSPRRLTVVREYYPKKEGWMKEYFSNPVKESLLVIVNEKPCDLIKKMPNVQVVECGRADNSIIARWVKGTCAKANVDIDLQTARTVAEYCLSDMVRVDNETQKLISYALFKGQITQEDVDLLVNRDSEYKIYEMTDYIGQKKFDKAFTVVKELLNKGEPLQKLFVSVYNYFRTLLHVSLSELSDDKLAAMLSVPSFVIKKAKTQAKAFKKKSLKRVVDLMVETDYLVKSGVYDAEDRIWYDLFAVITA
ncbi:MAG: DNA polymerase III subunit delta [Clostridia bacterium]|nr:DNA polymerase III subunit delta [Clostridia bacterium]